MHTLKKLISETPANALGMITANLPIRPGYGRIKRDAKNKVIGIVEEKDAQKRTRHHRNKFRDLFCCPQNY